MAKFSANAAALVLAVMSGTSALACDGLPTHDAVRNALSAARSIENGGLNFHMWATIVDRDGVVCTVTYSGNDRGDQWPGSRVISAQKANTANAFSLPGFALSSANLYAAVQPGGSLYGLQDSNPVQVSVAYEGPADLFGQALDPMVGKRIGGVNVFGGGLALYDRQGRLLGGLGVSGDTSCVDHIIAWKVRHALGFDYVPNGVSAKTDNILHDITAGSSASGYGHPSCSDASSRTAESLLKQFSPRSR